MYLVQNNFVMKLIINFIILIVVMDHNLFIHFYHRQTKNLEQTIDALP
jgi:hypothetical protein